jgi:hypothetical protein
MRHARDLVCLIVALLLSAQPALAQSPPKPPDAKAIATLIAQLGSADFQERKAATKSLEAIGRPALAALREAADKHDDAEVRRRAKELVEKIENSLEQLLEDYKAYGLPVPTKDTPLVRFESGAGSTEHGVEYPPSYSLGFLLKPGTKTEPPDILRGSLRYQPHWNPPVTRIDPTKATPKDIDGWVADAAGDLFFLAIQCKARGWDTLAQTFFERRPKERETQVLRAKLRRDAWYYWQFQLTRPETDWGTAARCMHVLIRTDADVDTWENRALLKSLDLALVPSKSKPGSIEAIIDALVNASSIYVWSDDKPDSSFARLAEKGFEAVPALIEHLDDDRLTRCFSPEFRHYRIRHLAIELLEGLAGENLGEGGLRALRGELAQKKKARAWWEEAKKIGEEAYALAHVVPKKADWPNEQLIWLIQRKYPRHLPTLYHTVLDERPQLESGLLAKAVARSGLSRQQKMGLLIYGARHESKERRRDAFEAIAILDHELFVDTVVKMLDELPRTPKGNYWRCPEQKVVSLVLRTEDARVWKALDKAARRVDVGLRMQLLRRVANDGDDNERCKERLAFLRSFLDDATLRDMSSDPDRYVAVPAGDDFPRLEVRNHAALEIGRLLKLDRTPVPNWDDAQWARFRQEVRDALKR